MLCSSLLASEPGRLAQPLVQHPVQPLDFVGVTLDGVGQFLDPVAGEMVLLLEHRPDAADLKHRPFPTGVTPGQISICQDAVHRLRAGSACNGIGAPVHQPAANRRHRKAQQRQGLQPLAQQYPAEHRDGARDEIEIRRGPCRAAAC